MHAGSTYQAVYVAWEAHGCMRVLAMHHVIYVATAWQGSRAPLMQKVQIPCFGLGVEMTRHRSTSSIEALFCFWSCVAC